MLTLGVSRGTIGGTMKVLVELDEGLLQLVDAEASAAGATRLKVVRELLVEGLRARAAGRGEEFPEVEAWCPQDELAVALRTHECTDRCVPAAACGRASLTPGYAPCRRPQHDDGPCAHAVVDLMDVFEEARQHLASLPEWSISSGTRSEIARLSATLKGQDVISARVNDGTEAVILSRPVRTAHEAVTEPIASASIFSDSYVREPIARRPDCATEGCSDEQLANYPLCERHAWKKWFPPVFKTSSGKTVSSIASEAQPSYNHTRGDSALNPCSICAGAQEDGLSIIHPLSSLVDVKTVSSGKAESKTVSSIASEAQTVAEERMRDRTAKPVASEYARVLVIDRS